MRFLGGTPRLVERVEIARETRCQWVDSAGRHWWKAGRKATDLIHRYLMTEAEYLAAGGAL